MHMPSPESTIQIESHQDLLAVLSEHDIATDIWGTHGKRTTADLHHEIAEGECVLYTDEAGRLRKYGSAIKMDVIYSDADGNFFRLVEFGQYDPQTNTFTQRGTRYTLGEKVKTGQGEDADAGAVRALSEELKVCETLGLWATGQQVWPPVEDFDYPGLYTVSDTSYYVAQLRAEDYDPQGYVETARKETCFVWEQITPSAQP